MFSNFNSTGKHGRQSHIQLTEMFVTVLILCVAVSVELGEAAPTDVYIHLHGIGMAANAGKFRLAPIIYEEFKPIS